MGNRIAFRTHAIIYLIQFAVVSSISLYADSDSVKIDSATYEEDNDSLVDPVKWDWEEIVDTGESQPRKIDVDMFIHMNYPIYVIDTTVNPATIHILIYGQFDTLFLDSIGRNSSSSIGNMIGYEIPIEDIGLLNYCRKTKFSFAPRIPFTDPTERFVDRRMGYLHLKPCQEDSLWFPVSVVIRRTDRYQKADTLRLDERFAINKGKLLVLLMPLLPGTYECLGEVCRVVDPKEAIWVEYVAGNCDTICIYDIVITQGKESAVSPCEILEKYLTLEDNEVAEGGYRVKWQSQ